MGADWARIPVLPSSRVSRISWPISTTLAANILTQIRVHVALHWAVVGSVKVVVDDAAVGDFEIGLERTVSVTS